MQYSIPAALLSALSLSQLVSGQGAPLPEVTGDSGSDSGSCGGCYAVAGIAGIVFGNVTIPATQVNSEIAITGLNGTTTLTSTAIQFETGAFSITSPGGIIAPSGPVSTPAPVFAFNTQGSILVYSGVTLTSPTKYNVITAFSTTRTTNVGGQCSVVSGPSQALLTPFTVPIPDSVTDFASFARVAEQSFIANMGLGFCSGGAASVTPTSIIPVTVNSTTTTTVTSSRGFTPQPAMVATTTASAAPFLNSTVLITPSGTGPLASTTATLITEIPASTETAFTIVEASNFAGRETAAGTLLTGMIAMIMGLVA